MSTEESWLPAIDPVVERMLRMKQQHRRETVMMIDEDLTAGVDFGVIGQSLLARWLEALAGSGLKYTKALGGWRWWNGRYWPHDENGNHALSAVRELVTIVASIADGLAGQIHDLREEDKEKNAGRIKGLEGRLKRIRDVLKAASTLGGQNGILGQLAGYPRVAVAEEMWDADPWLLNNRTGTFDLRPWVLRDHNPDDLLTKMTDAGWDVTATCPTFLAHLERFLPDPAVRAYFQRALGHALLGRVREHMMLVMWGSGRNGKGALIKAFLRCLSGGYATTSTAELILSQRDSQHPADMMKLKGRRLVFMEETRSGRYLDAGKFKMLTGGSVVDAHGMHQDWESFDPSHLLVLATNNKPRVGESDRGTWDRLKLVPFTVSLPDAEQDRSYDDKLALEIDGILQWLVEGYRLYEAEGSVLVEPQAVLDAIAEYREESTPFTQFAAESIEETGVMTEAIYSGGIISRWTVWARARNERPDQVNNKTLRGLMEAEGFTVGKHTRRGTPWYGLRFRESGLGDLAEDYS